MATPTVADVNGDGRPEIVVGGQEQYVEPTNIGDGADVLGLLGAAGTPGNSRLYVIAPDGTHADYPNSSANPDAEAYLPGWPVTLSQLATGLLPDHRRRRGHARGGGRRRRQPPRARDRGRVVGRDPLRARRPGPQRLRRHVDGRPAGGLGRRAGAPARVAVRRRSQLAATSWPRSIGLSGPTIGRAAGRRHQGDRRQHRRPDPLHRPAGARPPAAQRRPALDVGRRRRATSCPARRTPPPTSACSSHRPSPISTATATTR